MSQGVMENYEHLEKIFMDGIEANNRGDAPTEEKLFKSVLAEEPRMCEPRLELASIYLQRGDLTEAEEHAREALHYLERGWKWLENLSDEQMMAHACNLLGEILKQVSTTDEILAQGDEAIRSRWQEAGELFERAAELDPDNNEAVANYFSFKKLRVPRAQTRSSGR